MIDINLFCVAAWIAKAQYSVFLKNDKVVLSVFQSIADQIMKNAAE